MTLKLQLFWEEGSCCHCTNHFHRASLPSFKRVAGCPPQSQFRWCQPPNPPWTHFFPLPTHICGMCVCVCVYPTTNGGMQNGSSVDIHTHCVHVFARFGADLYVQSMVIKKNFCIGAQSEVYWECVVGWVGVATAVTRARMLHCTWLQANNRRKRLILSAIIRSRRSHVQSKKKKKKRPTR